MLKKSSELVRISFVFLVVQLSITATVSAQLESSKWIFGNGAGLDFNSGQPVSFSGSKIKTSEGCSTYSNSRGDLQLYTDGVSVWNKNHTLMPNGTGLNGHLSSTQSAIIVPLPGSKSLVYVFTMDSEANKGGFCYSVVDLTRDQGLGDVTLKNKLIKDHCTEKLLAIKHGNGKDIWIVIHEYGSDAFMAYLLTKDGLSLNPIISNIGLRYDKSVYNTIGYIKVAANNKKIAVAINGDQIVQLFDFDANNAVLSNSKTIRFSQDASPYGLEFSQNCQFLYIGIVTKGLVCQVNIASGSEVEIQKSMCIVGQNATKKNVGALQLSVDGKIYIAEYQCNYLSSIENPNLPGKDCLFKLNAISLNQAICMFGLPTFFQDLIQPYHLLPKYQVFDKLTEINKKYILSKVYFDFDKATLRDSSVVELQKLVAFLKLSTKLHIEITGHTDSLGTTVYNNKLSLARAMAIAQFLIHKGVSSNRITFFGKGCSEPIDRNTDEAGRQNNRRVEFILKE